MRFALLLVAVAGCAGQLGMGFVPSSQPAAPRPAPPPAAATAPGGVTTGAGATMSASVSFSLDIQFYGVPLGGANDIVFVLDRSGSMSGGKLDDAKQQLAHVIDRLPDGTRVGLVFFNSRVHEWTYASLVGSQTADMVATDSKALKFLAGATAAVATKKSGNDRRLVPLSASYRHYAHRFISGIRPSGSTAAVPALRNAGTIGARHVVFLSDGLANSGGDGRDLLDLAHAFAQHGIRVDTIGLGRDQDYSVLQQMAAITGGLAVVH